MRRAARTDANQQAVVDALRAAGASVWIIGLPVDLIAGKNGATVLIEVKTLIGKRKPKAAKYTQLQRDFMADWRGGPVVTVTDVESALRAIETLKG